MRATTRDVTTTEFRGRLAEWLRLVEMEGAHVLVTRNGTPVAALLPVEDAAVMEEVAATSLRRLRESQEAAQRTWAALRRQTGREE